MSTLGLCMNLLNTPVSQYGRLDFTSLCVYKGRMLAGCESGLYGIQGDSDFDSEDIYSMFEIPSTDLGTKKPKKVRSIFITGWMMGSLRLTVLYDNKVGNVSYTIPATGTMQEETIRVPVNSDEVGRYIGLRIDNMEGADYSIDSIDMLILPTVYTPKTPGFIGRGDVEIPIITGEASGT